MCRSSSVVVGSSSSWSYSSSSSGSSSRLWAEGDGGRRTVVTVHRTERGEAWGT